MADDHQSYSESDTDPAGWQVIATSNLAELNGITDSSKRAQLLRQTAAIYDSRLDNPESAFELLKQAFSENPGHRKTIEGLEQLTARLDRWAELVELVAQALPGVPGRLAQIHLALKLGDWSAEELGLPENAFAYYHHALQLDDKNLETLKRMADLYGANDQWSDMAAVLDTAAGVCPDPEETKGMLLLRAEVLEQQLHELDQALATCERALKVDPAYVPVLEAMARIYEKQERPWQVIPTLRKKVGALKDPAETIAVHIKLAELLVETADDREGAREEYRNALKVDPSNGPALSALRNLLQEEGRTQDLRTTLEQQLEHLTEDKERIKLLEELAALIEEELTDQAGAAQRWEQLLDLVPEHEQALVSLTRLYQRLRQWDDFKRVLASRLELAEDAAAQAALYVELGQVAAKELGDLVQAEGYFTEALATLPDSAAALDGLAQVQAQQKDWLAALETLQLLLDVVQEKQKRAEILCRQGEIALEQLSDLVVAADYFMSAREAAPQQPAALAGLRRIHMEQEDWLDAAEILRQEQELTESPTAKAMRQYELGYVQAQMGRHKEALNWFEEAHKNHQFNEPAAEALADIYIDNQRFAEAQPLLDMLVRLERERTNPEKHKLHSQVAAVALALGKPNKALESAELAFKIDPTHLPSLINLARAQFGNQIWEPAFRSYHRLVVSFSEKITSEQQVDALFHMGSIRAKLKEPTKAITTLRKALEIDPGHLPSLEQLVAIFEGQKRHKEVVSYKLQTVEVLGDERKYETLVEVGKLCQEVLRDQEGAIDALVRALVLRPGDRPLMHKLLPLFQQTGKWDQVVDLIAEIAALESDGVRMARLEYSRGVVLRDKLEDEGRALESFNKALDSDPNHLDAFRAVDTLLTKKKDWPALEANYVRMIERVSGRGRQDLEASLWHFLGEVRRSRLGDFASAAAAFRQALDREPEHKLRREILAELLAQFPERVEEAADEYRRLLQLDPTDPKFYREMGRLYVRHQRHDQAWCASSAVVVLGRAGEKEQAFFERFRPGDVPPAKTHFAPNTWRELVVHPDDSSHIGKIFEIITPAVTALTLQQRSVYNLKRKQRVREKDQSLLSTVYFYAAGMLNLPVVPELYVQEDNPGFLGYGITDPPVSICGSRLLAWHSPKHLMFFLTRHLSYYRASCYLRQVLPTEKELKLLLLAGLKLGNPKYEIPQEGAEVINHYIQVLSERLDPLELSTLGTAVQGFIASGESDSIRRWMNGIEFSACRAGLALTGELPAVVEAIHSDPAPSGARADNKIHDLLRYNMSAPYHKLRRGLGIDIDSRPEAQIRNSWLPPT